MREEEKKGGGGGVGGGEGARWLHTPPSQRGAIKPPLQTRLTGQVIKHNKVRVRGKAAG